jgi:hypothetical protein
MMSEEPGEPTQHSLATGSPRALIGAALCEPLTQPNDRQGVPMAALRGCNAAPITQRRPFADIPPSSVKIGRNSFARKTLGRALPPETFF